jgi:hypothetical protein
MGILKKCYLPNFNILPCSHPQRNEGVDFEYNQSTGYYYPLLSGKILQQERPENPPFPEFPHLILFLGGITSRSLSLTFTDKNFKGGSHGRVIGFSQSKPFLSDL